MINSKQVKQFPTYLTFNW